MSGLCARGVIWRGPALAALVWSVLAVHGANGATLVVGPEGQPRTFADALAQARDGDEIVVLPGTYAGVVGVIEQRRLTIRGEGKRPVFQSGGRVAEGKAILVVRNGDIRLENLEFRGARAADGNGAGVRFERGRLEVVRCAFVDNEIGLLTSNDREAELGIHESEFAQAPRGTGGLNHLLYVGTIARLTLTGSHLRGAYRGHLVKSRARRSDISYNMIRDGSDGEASYEVDLPNGGQATLVGNVIGQSARTQNAVVVSYGAEGRVWSENTLTLSHNTLVNEGWRPAWFLRVHSAFSAGTEVMALNNLLVGIGIFGLGTQGRFEGNRQAELGMLVDPSIGAFELHPDSILRGRAPDPRSTFDRDLAPKAEFEWPARLLAIPADRERWSPGAFQR